MRRLNAHRAVRRRQQRLRRDPAAPWEWDRKRLAVSSSAASRNDRRPEETRETAVDPACYSSQRNRRLAGSLSVPLTSFGRSTWMLSCTFQTCPKWLGCTGIHCPPRETFTWVEPKGTTFPTWSPSGIVYRSRVTLVQTASMVPE